MDRIRSNHEASAYIRDRRDFTNKTKTFYGKRVLFVAKNVTMDKHGDVVFASATVVEQASADRRTLDCGMLPLRYSVDMITSGFTGHNLYIVYSYDTPIGYTEVPLHWAMHIPPVRYSLKTITEHQRILYDAEGRVRDDHLSEQLVVVPDLRKIGRTTT